MQATNRLKHYSRIIVFEKLIFGLTVIALILIGVRSYQPLVIVDLCGKCLAFALAIYYCKDIVIGRPVSLAKGLREALDNVRVGIKLMFANIASMLIMGIVRFGMEQKWDIEAFGKVSLTLSISNMLMIFINAVGTVLYPMLRNTSPERLPGIYRSMRDVLMIALIGMLVAFYPAKWIFTLWLPQYSDALPYMAFLFPVCVYESKMSMLINTYFKTLRKEKLMMVLNWITVGISFLSTYICIFILKNLTLTVLSITFLLAFKCILSEIMLARIININVYGDIVLEFCMTIIFITSGWFLGNIYGLVSYFAAYTIYLLIKRKDVAGALRLVKKARAGVL
ncbi:MAG: hypothetical protein PHE79_01565 [Eubacteriales bacterium]|nr:hypothetical protein [Eubacteriales bacterium]